MNPLLLVDFYKIHHKPMYPDGMTKLYSNGTCRKSRMPGVNEVVVFGIQHFCKKYLIDSFDKYFFEVNGKRSHYDKKQMIDEYKRHCQVDTTHIEELWELGYLPIEIKAIEEGDLCPIGVPMFTITNTHPNFGWLVNYLETLMSCCLWQAFTSATIAHEYRKLLNKYAIETVGSAEFVQWQGHDFSMRGMSSPDSAKVSGMGHLLSFTGTDTVPAIYELERYYEATGLIGASVPATEHSVMCMGTKEEEIDTFRRLMSLYPTGILSIVSDTWNLWDVCTKFLPELKSEIMARDGKIVIRPDSGDPVDIICGKQYKSSMDAGSYDPEYVGLIRLLWDVFGGTINEHGYKVLDPHVGAIYGDSITLDRAEKICERLKVNGFASTNIVLGIGSYTYQYNTRDTFGFAIKATYGEIETLGFENGETYPILESREIFKDPITDDGTKRSKKGLLAVFKNEAGKPYVKDQCTPEEEKTGELKTVFRNGALVKELTLDQVRTNLQKHL